MEITSGAPHILIVCGATASGKTALSACIADQIPAEILSADSRQVYKYLSIGTAKPSPEFCRKVPHHCIDMIEPDQPFSAADFESIAAKKIIEISERKKTPVVVGGSGLYIRALVDGLFDGPGASSGVRQELEEKLKTQGIESLVAELQSVDPVTASSIDKKNPRRLIRAIEVVRVTGVTIAEHHRRQERFSRYDVTMIALEWTREQLYERINRRVDEMLHAGLVDEARSLLSRGYSKRLPALQTVGYVETFAFLSGEIGEERMAELIKQNSRRYAKRQLTWFKKEKRIQWVKVQSENDLKIAGKKIAEKWQEKICRGGEI